MDTSREKILEMMRRGFLTWNDFREHSMPAMIDLSGVDFTEHGDLGRFNFTNINLRGCRFDQCGLLHTEFNNADLTGANFVGAVLWNSSFVNSDLTDAILYGAELDNVMFSKCNLTGARMNEAKLLKTRFKDCILSGCSIYGISAWGVSLENCIQSNLRITLDVEADVTVDNLEVAQFIYLLINSNKIRDVIDTITSKVVLILGRFTPEKFAVLEAIADLLRQQNYLPVIFNFEKPVSRDISETVSILAGLSKFVIADITNARSVPQELMRVVPSLPSVPVLPILGPEDREYGMFEHFKKFPWVQELYRYSRQQDLLHYLEKYIQSMDDNS